MNHATNKNLDEIKKFYKKRLIKISASDKKSFKLEFNDNDSVKLIQMEPGTSVPLHSHSGKEFILVLEGSFVDEYGEYSKGDMQINDQNIKHNPTACKKNRCICLSITENDVVFFGKFGSLLNLATFVKSFFK